NYTATTNVDGDWSLTIPASDLANLGEANYVLSASGTNDNGNSASGSTNMLVDTRAPQVTIDSVTGDDIISIEEAAGAVTISGSTQGAQA
ncbi:hypothetical protein M3M33_14620, partial [Loigolactobacillus coryniformis]|uniref:hypothetical protein n=1 Tax=Loigolactobacillus coryniformis TaxID=1610 RepID=UPI00201A9055